MPIFAFGSNGSGQLGLGHTEDISIPEKCLFDEVGPMAEKSEGVVKIAAGGNHTLVLLVSGAVYAAGSNVDGRCGQHQSGTESLLRFMRVVVTITTGREERKFETFKNISATWEGSFLVTPLNDAEDAIFALGTGLKGELGLGANTTQATIPIQIPNYPPPKTRVVSIASGMGHTAMVLSSGEIYGWGAARKGQLGDAAKAQKVVWSPTKVDGVLFHATDVACGREFTVVSGDRKEGEFMILGSPDDKWGIFSDRPQPVRTPGSGSNGTSTIGPFSSIYTGWHAVYVHLKNDFIAAWGRNDRGQLPPTDLPGPKQLAVGSEHALILFDGMRRVVAFGWGEHGNCAIPTDVQGNVRARYNEIQLPEIGPGREIVGVGAGCATSWIITS